MLISQQKILEIAGYVTLKINLWESYHHVELRHVTFYLPVSSLAAILKKEKILVTRLISQVASQTSKFGLVTAD